MPELIIDDRNYREHIGDGSAIHFDGHPRLLTAMPRQTQYGMCEGARPLLEAMPLIPRSEWDDRIAALDREDAWLHGVALRHKIPCGDQNGLSLCWSWGTTLCVMAMRAQQGLPYVPLAPESLASSVGWSNRGNYVDATLKVVRDQGLCSDQYIDKRYSLNPGRWKAGWKEDCANHRVESWLDMDVPGKVWDAAMTCTLLRFPYAAGFGWWRHLVAGGFKARKNGNRYEILYRNSWGPSYGEDGWFWMAEGKGTPDIGCFAPTVVTASEA